MMMQFPHLAKHYFLWINTNKEMKGNHEVLICLLILVSALMHKGLCLQLSLVLDYQPSVGRKNILTKKQVGKKDIRWDY